MFSSFAPKITTDAKPRYKNKQLSDYPQYQVIKEWIQYDKRGTRVVYVKIKCKCNTVFEGRRFEIFRKPGEKTRNKKCPGCTSIEKKTKHAALLGAKFGIWEVVEMLPLSLGGQKIKLKCPKGHVKLTKLAHAKRRPDILCNECHDWAKKHGALKKTDGLYPITYQAWRSMKSRCKEYSPEAHLYFYRGIRVCDRWEKSFIYFLEDMGEKPSREYVLDRINVDGNYEPENCRWITAKENSANRRVSLNNREKFAIIDRDKLCSGCKDIALKDCPISVKQSRISRYEKKQMPL